MGDEHHRCVTTYAVATQSKYKPGNYWVVYPEEIEVKMIEVEMHISSRTSGL
jgi:hypothetical protein